MPMSGLGESSVARRMLALMRRGNIDYQCFRVYARSLEEVIGEEAHTRLPPGYRFVQVSAADLEACAVAELRACASYGGPESYLFAIARDDGVPVCVQCIWHGTRYREHAFWPLDERDAASMHLVTVESEQGKGLANVSQAVERRAAQERKLLAHLQPHLVDEHGVAAGQRKGRLASCRHGLRDPRAVACRSDPPGARRGGVTGPALR